MKRSVKVLLVILAIVLTAVLTYFGTCLYLTANWTPAVSADPVAAKIEELSAYVDRYFIDDYDTDAMVAAAADGAAEAFVTATGDRWSYYVSA